MGDNESQVKINIITTADPAGVQQARSQYDDLFDGLKKGIADALSAGGADSKFIAHVVDEFERLNVSLKETGASGDEVAEKIAKLEQKLQADAIAEQKRVAQLKVNFEMALHEKDVQKEAAANQRRRREEDQLAMEAEGRELKKNTELLEAEIMVRLKAQREAKEAVNSTQALGGAMKGVQRDIGGAAMQAAYFVDDMQYGIRGILNNIPQLVMTLGMGGGIAGVLSIAAVAANFLWEKFGGASEAKEEVEKVNESLSAMHRALEGASKAADEAFQKDLKGYLAEVDRVTDAWTRGGDELQKILGYHNDIAAVQTKIANSQLEIERQTALAGANTDDERKAINTKFDARKAALNDASEIDQAKRNLEAEQANREQLRRQFSNVDDVSINAQGRIGQTGKDQKAFVDQFGDQSDQGKRVREAQAARDRVLELQEQQRKQKQFDIERPATNAGDVMARAEAAKKLQDEIEAAAKDREVKNTGIAGDKEALASGKGLTFKRLKDDAAEAEKKGDTTAAIGLTKVREEAEKRQKQIDEQREAAEKALAEATVALAKIREAQAESERQLALKKLQLQAAELKDSEDFAKAGVAKLAAEKEAAEKLRKQQMEEQARKLENDAQAAEQRGDTKGAEEARRKAAEYKLPDNATPEQKRKVELDVAAQREKDKPKTVNAGDLATKAAHLAENMGPAGEALAKAAEKLKDGADNKELTAVLNAFLQLSPAVTQKFADSDKKLKAFEDEINKLKLQLRSTQV